MDPNANLTELLDIARRIAEEADEGVSEDALLTEGDRLAELALALDEWLSRGGFLPKRWER